MKLKECTLDALVLEIYDPKNRIVYRNKGVAMRGTNGKSNPTREAQPGPRKQVAMFREELFTAGEGQQ